MKVKTYILFTVLVLFEGSSALADSPPIQEYQLKAAFLYNFIKFVDWPEEASDANKPIIIGIIGNNPFGNTFEPVKDKLVKDRKVIIKWFEGLSQTDNPQIEAIRECNLLFICSSEKGKLKETLDLLKDRSVLTVADTQGFLEAGGIVNFVIEENKVAFEINTVAAEQANLKIRSQLLRLAKRVVEK